MGFYHPAVVVKDAQRHGLRVKPIDVTCSEWNCSLEQESGAIILRMGLRYVRGLQQSSAETLVRERREASFASIDDLVLRVPELNKANLAMLARIGALNNISGEKSLHRRDALWQIEQAVRSRGPMFDGVIEADTPSPLKRMNVEERLVSDFHGTSMTVGPHPMSYRRHELRAQGIKSSIELKTISNGKWTTVAGCVITRQRPGTAKGIIFMTLEDETGTCRVIVMPDFYEKNRITVLKERFVQVSGQVQSHDGVVHLKARAISSLAISAAETSSHDFS